MSERDDSAASALGQLLRQGASPGTLRARDLGHAGPGWQRVGERRLLLAFREEVTPSRPSERRWRMPARAFGPALGLVGVLTLIVFLGWPSAAPRPSLSFAVRSSGAHASARPGAPLDGSTGPSVIEFSDGSSFTLHVGTKASLSRVDALGATIILERGRMDAKVTPAPGANWSVDAGPYRVQVIGTVFTTIWEPDAQRCSVLLEQGSVRIVGGSIQGSVELRPGQRFDARASGPWSVTALTAEPGASGERSSAGEPARPSPEARPAEAAPADVAPTPRSATPGKSAGSTGASLPLRRLAAGRELPVQKSQRPTAPVKQEEPNWTALVNQGKFEQVVARSEERGFEQCLASCTIDDLWALADAARYTGRVALARDALHHLRTRAPEDAPRAGFFLGSLSESRGQAADALVWYTRYVKESPTGALVAEARAGRMRTLLVLGRRREARTQAEEYLRLHPRGVAAERARQLSIEP